MSTDLAIAPERVAELPAVDLGSAAKIARFGEAEQRELASCADRILQETKGRDLGDASALLAELISRVKGLDPAELERSGGLARLFGGVRRALIRFRSKYETVSAQVEGVAAELDKRVDLMRRDLVLLDGLHDETRATIARLDQLITAGQAHVEALRRQHAAGASELVPLASDGTERLLAAQDHHDALQALDRVEKRIGTLRQSRQLAVQQLPQIRIVQNGDAMLIESLSASINLTIPAWKQQIAMLLGLARQREALGMQTAVNAATTAFLRQASETLKTQAIAIEERSQHAIVDTETLAKTNQDLIDTLSAVIDLQAEGRRKRAEAEREMERQTAALTEALARPPAPVRAAA